MRRSSYILATLSAMMLASCANDDIPMRSEMDGRLHVEFEVKGYSPATRANIPAEDGETNIGSLYLLFFAPDEYQNGAYIDHIVIDDAMSMVAVIDLAQHPDISTDDPYEILAVANIADNRYIADNAHTLQIDAWLQGMAGKTLSQVMQEADALVAGGDDNSNAIAPDGLLMSTSATKPEGQSKISLLFTRNVVRFDVYNTPDDRYDLMSASIWNAYPETSIWGASAMDYSETAPRIERFYGVSNRNNTTGVAGQDGNGELLGDIVGGLYAFENQVITPQDVDKLTTCLIIGLRDRSAGTTSYYRANMNPAGSPQILSRNNVYRLTITDVTGPGYDTEEIAYNGRGSNLTYTVGMWNVDDNGLIVQDANSILSLPTKTINIGRDGGEFDYSTFITSKLPNPGPLSVLSQMYDPADGGIVTSINGNIIHVEATPLEPDQTERRGIVILTYAGLQTAINIVQSGAAVTFLKVVLPDGGITVFPPFADQSSDLVEVEASGPWSAKVYMDGFSFTTGQLVTEISSTEVAYVADDKFRIYPIPPTPTLRSGRRS